MCKQKKKAFLKEWEDLENWTNAVTILEGIKILKESNCEEREIVWDFILPQVGEPLIKLLKWAEYSDKQIIEKIKEVYGNCIEELNKKGDGM